MKIKKLLSVLLIASVVTLSATACGTSTPTVSTSSMPSTVSQSSVNSTSSGITKYSDDNDTKVRQMLDNVTLNGKPLKIPYKLSDLGEGYTFDSSVDIEEKDGRKYVLTNLLHNDIILSPAYLYNYSENQSEYDFIACSISCSELHGNSVIQTLKIDGIGELDSKNDVLNKFGKPTECISTDTGEKMYYKIDDNRYIALSITNNKITYMFIISKVEYN